MSKRFSLGLGIALVLLCVTVVTNAYNLKTYQWSADPTMEAATESFASGTAWRDDLETGVGRWNGLWGMWLEFDLDYTSATSGSHGDGINHVAFVSSSTVGGNWGVHYPRTSGSTLIESDIWFNASAGWLWGPQDERVRNTSNPAFLKVVVHEFGHSVGLLHESGELADMAQGYSGHLWYGGSDKYRHHPMPDDCQGARALFPYSNDDIDASAMNFEMSGSSATQLWRNNSTNTVITPGGSVSCEYTVTNAGNIGINFNARIYFSTNEYISTYDTYVGGFDYYLPAHYAWERDKTFTVPSSLSAGTYYMGLVIDSGDDLAEHRESNNRLVFPGTWQVL